MPDLPYIDAEVLTRAVSWRQAIDALGDALNSGLDVTAAPPRSRVPTAHGEMLLMPAESAGAVGVKLVGIAPGNTELGLSRIQALYVLFDPVTLAPAALLDGAALTALRTPAVTALAVRQLARPDAATLTVFGSGPQAEAHVHAIRAIRPIAAVSIVARRAGRADDLVARLRADGLDARAGTPEQIATSDIVVCATNSELPVFDGARLAAHACVAAIGAHRSDARELDDQVFARAARVVVEDRDTALREAGDIVLAIGAGALTADRLTTLAELPGLRPADGITVFKSVGMAWQDLVVAEAAWAAIGA
jgi:ornithine cyclodeaminase/alanine dehydrogenase-like protein (mu-crystallin family)